MRVQRGGALGSPAAWCSLGASIRAITSGVYLPPAGAHPGLADALDVDVALEPLTSSQYGGLIPPLGSGWTESIFSDLPETPLRSPMPRTLAWNRHGRVAAIRTIGANHSGGPFEIVFIGVYLTDGDRIQHYEVFGIEDTDRAVARFEELCAARAARG